MKSGLEPKGCGSCVKNKTCYSKVEKNMIEFKWLGEYDAALQFNG
jgi:hypothetical protein